MSEVKKFKKGDIIMKEGELGNCMYDITSGKVGIYKNYGLSDEVLLSELENEIMGEMGYVRYEARTATAVALEDVEAVMIGDKDFEEYVSNNTERVVSFICKICDRTREAAFRLMSLQRILNLRRYPEYI